MQTLPAPVKEDLVKRALPVYDPPLMFPDTKWTQQERFHYVADLIESLPAKHFDMTSWFNLGDVSEFEEDTFHRFDSEKITVANLPTLMHRCGTTACIAGWIAVDQIHPAFTLKTDHEAEQWSARWLDIDATGGHKLFTDHGWWGQQLDRPIYSLEDITQDEAVEVLRGIAQGNIDLWD